MTISLPTGAVPGHVSEEYDWHAELGAVLAGDLLEWRLVVAPQRGIFHAAAAEDNQSGTVVGYIEARRDRQAIVAPWRGAIIEWLVQDGDPVTLGQPVARLLPDAPSDGTE
jgi:biotin carboxyl carrier protein